MEVTVYIKKAGQDLLEGDSLDFLANYSEGDYIWLDVETEESEDFSPIAKFFNLHELAVEDCFTPGHFPKLEEYANCVFLMLRGLKSISEVEEIREHEELVEEYNSEKLTRGLGIFLGSHFIITHRLYEVSWLDAFVRQYHQNSELHQTLSPADLTMRICNTLTSRFLRGVNYFEDEIDQMEDAVIKSSGRFDMLDLLDMKRDLNILMSISRDLKNIFLRLSSEPSLIPNRPLRRYFKNIEDRSSMTSQSIQRLLDNLVSVRDVYLAVSNVRLGDIMRILAVITTVAAPLNLIVGIYGMNFREMPLLNNVYGFWFIFISILLIAISMLFYFKKKRWI